MNYRDVFLSLLEPMEIGAPQMLFVKCHWSLVRKTND